jgi:hypothetical protein
MTMNNMIMAEIRRTKEQAEAEQPPERCMWVDTVEKDGSLQAVVVRKNGSIVTYMLEEISVAQDSAPFVLLNPEIMQEVLQKRLGNHAIQVNPQGFTTGPPVVGTTKGMPVPGPVKMMPPADIRVQIDKHRSPGEDDPDITSEE